ncbi:hypothetical protein B0T25DRAFT_283410 [Lasiosphaeria hispida]|uniref:Uncharacterized protein n=1 Tax=Lasiosphaeria hispida TaxID=260671 RepID=A0AAJ0HBP5_9PEZI|nr:hypothetical protein B0T25DRAFT_283410 [Lasiosphaeria hispida]
MSPAETAGAASGEGAGRIGVTTKTPKQLLILPQRCAARSPVPLLPTAARLGLLLRRHQPNRQLLRRPALRLQHAQLRPVHQPRPGDRRGMLPAAHQLRPQLRRQQGLGAVQHPLRRSDARSRRIIPVLLNHHPKPHLSPRGIILPRALQHQQIPGAHRELPGIQVAMIGRDSQWKLRKLRKVGTRRVEELQRVEYRDSSIRA